MSTSIEISLAFLLYLILWGWIGYQQGTRRQLIIFIVAVASYLFLLERGDIPVRFINLGSKFAAFIQGGGLGADPAPGFEAVTAATPWVTADQMPGVLFLLWVIILLFTFWITARPDLIGESNSEGWAAILGMLNGLFLTSVLLPRILTIVPMTTVNPAAGATFGGVATAPLQGVLGILWAALGLLFQFLGTIWQLIQPQRSEVLLVLLLAIMALAIYSLRVTPSRKSK